MKLHFFLSISLLSFVTACSSPPALHEVPSPLTAAHQQVVPVEALNPDVQQSTIQQTICIAGYTASVRPSTTYTNGVKFKLLREKELPISAASEFELDHRIPLALGGHPRNLQNLMLQPWEGKDGAKVKDRLERRLQQLVCTAKLQLEDARRAIYMDWQGAYRTYIQDK